MAGAALIIMAILGVGYILLNAGGGYVDTATGTGPRSVSGLVNQLANAIAHAEGFFIPGSRSARDHNPGDITDVYLSSGRDSGGLSTFIDDQTGWDALTHKLENILAGMSQTYPLSMTIQDLALTWTGGDLINGPGATEAWASKVASGIGASTDTSLSDLVMA